VIRSVGPVDSAVAPLRHQAVPTSPSAAVWMNWWTTGGQRVSDWG
jgi:hypothetical protein